MINFLLFNVILFGLFVMGYILKKNDEENYIFFSIKHTTVLKGIGALLVLWGHVALCNGIKGVQFIAGAGVSLFLMCSGYGIEESYRKKDLSGFWKNKIFRVIVPYYIICLSGYIIRNFNCIKVEGLIRILNFQSQWYINYILINYLIFFVISYFLKDYKERWGAFTLTYVIWFVIDTLFFVSADAPFLRARQMYAFMTGIFISNNKEKCEKIIGKWLFILINLIVGLVFMVLTNTHYIKIQPIFISNILSLLTVVPLAFAIVGITMNLEWIFKNVFLYISGTLSYEIFLIHSNCLNLSSSALWGVLLFVAIVFVGSYLFNISYKKIREGIEQRLL